MLNANQPRGELVLVTGSTGLIGSRLLRELAHDYRVVGLDIHAPDPPVENTDWIGLDLTDGDAVREALARIRQDYGSRIASVVHLAAYYDFSGRPSSMYEKLTVQGTRRLLEGLKTFDAVEQFVFSSSLLVMEPVDELEERLTEDAPTRGEWDYPQSKLRAEQVLREEHGPIPVVVLRLAGVYDEMCHSLPIGQQIARIYEKQLESYVFPGDAERGQPFVHLDDAARCIRRTIESRRRLGPFELFLIAEPKVLSYRDLQDRLGELIHGREWPTLRIPKPVAKAGAWLKEKLPGVDPFIKPWMIDLADDHYPVEIGRARERLGWEPEHRLEHQLPKMIENLRRDPRIWYEQNGLPMPERLAEQLGGIHA